MLNILSKLVRFVLIAVVVCNGYGNVLCFGNDGHVAIEPAFHDHCSHDHDHGHYHDSDRTCREEAEHVLTVSCSPCTDVMVAADFEPVRTKNLTQSVFVYSGIGLTRAPVSFDHGRCGFNADSSSYFTPLRTIVLLT